MGIGFLFLTLSLNAAVASSQIFWLSAAFPSFRHFSAAVSISFPLRSALRQAPDLLLIGEVRDGTGKIGRHGPGWRDFYRRPTPATAPSGDEPAAATPSARTNGTSRSAASPGVSGSR